jgi:hypothetical protein
LEAVAERFAGEQRLAVAKRMADVATYALEVRAVFNSEQT